MKQTQEQQPKNNIYSMSLKHYFEISDSSCMVGSDVLVKSVQIAHIVYIVCCVPRLTDKNDA